MPTYEAWHDPDEHVYSCGTTEQMEASRRRGVLGPRSSLLYSFEAGTHEEAQAIHSLRMGWRPYRPEGEPEPCPTCNAFYYPQGSAECWLCRSRVATFASESKPSRDSAARFFLNVDLDIESTADLTPLVEALEPHAYSLERPPGRASFELNGSVSPMNPEPLILEFVRLVRGLQQSARAVWTGASRRVLDIGIQSRRRPMQDAYRLAPETLRAVAEVDAEIVVTIYALDPEDDRDNRGLLDV